MTTPDKATAARLAAKRLIELHAMGEDCYDEFKDYMRRHSIALAEALLAAQPAETGAGDAALPPLTLAQRINARNEVDRAIENDRWAQVPAAWIARLLDATEPKP